MIRTQPVELQHLIAGYQLCAATEGKGPNAIAIVANSVNYLQDFLSSQGMSTGMAEIGCHEIRAFSSRD